MTAEWHLKFSGTLKMSFLDLEEYVNRETRSRYLPINLKHLPWPQKCNKRITFSLIKIFYGRNGENAWNKIACLTVFKLPKLSQGISFSKYPFSPSGKSLHKLLYFVVSQWRSDSCPCAINKVESVSQVRRFLLRPWEGIQLLGWKPLWHIASRTLICMQLNHVMFKMLLKVKGFILWLLFLSGKPSKRYHMWIKLSKGNQCCFLVCHMIKC